MLRSLPRRVFALSLLAAAVGTARADEPSSYAVMSLVGDQLSIVTPRVQTGSHLDQNHRQVLPIPDDSLDATAARAADAAIRRVKPGARVHLYTTRDPKLFALQESLADSTEAAGALASSLKELLAQSRATHFILVTKHRDDARIKMASQEVGIGRLAGLGFYVDRHMELVDVATSKRNTGFLAPYAYLRFTLLDAATLKPLRASAVRESQVLPTTPGATQHPWDVATSGQKVDALEALIRRSVDSAVAQLLAPP